MAVAPGLLLGIYSFILLSSFASVLFLIEILRAIWNGERKEHLKFSIILKYYFCVLLIVGILMFIHSSTVIIIWRNDLQFTFFPFFLTGTMDATFMPTVPFTSFILTLDRCLILFLENKYNRRWTLGIFCTSILINVMAGGANLIMNILFHDSELPEGCAAYGCVLHFNAQLVYTYIRAAGSILCISVGILFLIATLWVKKTQPEIGNKVKAIAEAVVFRAVVLGLLCDFGPHVLDTVLMYMTGDTPSRYIGPYSRVIMTIDLLLNSFMNWLVFLKINNKITSIPFYNNTSTSARS